jgi:hypothetical protein
VIAEANAPKKIRAKPRSLVALKPFFLAFGHLQQENTGRDRRRFVMFIRLMGVVALVCCCSIGFGEEIVEIPLSDMWGQNIKGTKNAGELFPTSDIMSLAKDTNDKQVRWAIRKWVEAQPSQAIHINLSRTKRDPMPPGFVVGGADKAALLTAKMILCDGLDPKKSFSTENDLTLVLFTGTYDVFDLKPVTIEGNRINVQFEVPEGPFHTMLTIPHFALIPLGKLRAGDYSVVIPEAKRVCKSFQFEVK